MPAATPELLMVAATFLLAGFVKGVIGLGLPNVVMGLLGLIMAPAKAATLLLLPSLVTNIWQMLAGPSLRGLSRRLWSMLVGIGLGAWAGSGLIAGHSAHLATAGLGAALLAYAAVGLGRLQLHVAPGAEPWAAPLVGLANGVVTGATGVFVIPSGPYLSALGLSRDDLVQALGLTFTTCTVALAAGLAYRGALASDNVAGSLLSVLPALLGLAAGAWVRSRVRPKTFRLFFFLGLAALGAELVWHGLAR